MTIKSGKIIKIVNASTAEVEIITEPITDHDCCGSHQSTSSVHIEALNPVHAAVGDQVDIQDTTANANIALFSLALLFVLVLLIIGYSVWTPWGAMLAVLGFPFAWIINRKKVKAKPRVLAIRKVGNKDFD